MKFKTMFTYHQSNKGFVSTEPSMTIPNQSFTLPKVVERLRNGLPIHTTYAGYNPDGFPRYDDLTSLDQFKKLLQAKEQAINEKIAAIKAKEAAEQRDKADDAK